MKGVHKFAHITGNWKHRDHLINSKLSFSIHYLRFSELEKIVFRKGCAPNFFRRTLRPTTDQVLQTEADSQLIIFFISYIKQNPRPRSRIEHNITILSFEGRVFDRSSVFEHMNVYNIVYPHNMSFVREHKTQEIQFYLILANFINFLYFYLTQLKFDQKLLQ